MENLTNIRPKINLALIPRNIEVPHHCGLCGQNQSFSYTINVDPIPVELFEKMALEGWIRNGKSIYKRIIEKCCCKTFETRVDVRNFQISKNQKKIMKNFRKFLAGEFPINTNKTNDNNKKNLNKAKIGKDDIYIKKINDIIEEFIDKNNFFNESEKYFENDKINFVVIKEKLKTKKNNVKEYGDYENNIFILINSLVKKNKIQNKNDEKSDIKNDNNNYKEEDLYKILFENFNLFYNEYNKENNCENEFITNLSQKTGHLNFIVKNREEYNKLTSEINYTEENKKTDNNKKSDKNIENIKEKENVEFNKEEKNEENIKEKSEEKKDENIIEKKEGKNEEKLKEKNDEKKDENIIEKKEEKNEEKLKEKNDEKKDDKEIKINENNQINDTIEQKNEKELKNECNQTNINIDKENSQNPTNDNNNGSQATQQIKQLNDNNNKEQNETTTNKNTENIIQNTQKENINTITTSNIINQKSKIHHKKPKKQKSDQTSPSQYYTLEYFDELVPEPKILLPLKNIYTIELTDQTQSNPEKMALYSVYDQIVHKSQGANAFGYDMFIGYTNLISNENSFKSKIINYDSIKNKNIIPKKYGTYNLLHRINGRLIAVNVLDFLPNLYISDYCYYDPDYNFLNLGKFTGIREIEYIRYLNKFLNEKDQIKYYSMGYFTSNCLKMLYKSEFQPFQLRDIYTNQYVLFDSIKEKMNNGILGNWVSDDLDMSLVWFDGEVDEYLMNLNILCGDVIYDYFTFVDVFIVDVEKVNFSEMCKRLITMLGKNFVFEFDYFYQTFPGDDKFINCY